MYVKIPHTISIIALWINGLVTSNHKLVMANIISTSTYNFLFSELKFKNNIIHVINHFLWQEMKRKQYTQVPHRNTRLVCNKDKNSNIDYITYISVRGDLKKTILELTPFRCIYVLLVYDNAHWPPVSLELIWAPRPFWTPWNACDTRIAAPFLRSHLVLNWLNQSMMSTVEKVVKMLNQN